jgi:hypothetical protein
VSGNYSSDGIDTRRGLVLAIRGKAARKTPKTHHRHLWLPFSKWQRFAVFAVSAVFAVLWERFGLETHTFDDVDLHDDLTDVSSPTPAVLKPEAARIGLLLNRRL